MVEEFAVKYPYLFNYTTEVERKALCEACEDDEDTLMEWDVDMKEESLSEVILSLRCMKVLMQKKMHC